MFTRCADRDPQANLLERRWFSSITAARAAQAECDAICEAMELAQAAWRRAHMRLIELEALRDVLGEQLAEIDGQPHVPDSTFNLAVMTAA
jgi:hypothetical protein